MAEKYNVENQPLESVLGFIKSGLIAIPEIQRPFVWKPIQVRDLIDSLYMGYPTGYLIMSQSPDLKLKDGTVSVGKKIMIDGQQRISALMTSIAGYNVTNSDFREYRIKISFFQWHEDWRLTYGFGRRAPYIPTQVSYQTRCCRKKQIQSNCQFYVFGYNNQQKYIR